MEVKETSDAKLKEDAGQRTLNQYNIKETLGRGAYGTVYRAVDTNNGNAVAIKEMDAKKLKRSKMTRGPGAGGIRGRFRGRGGFSGGQSHESLASAPSSPPTGGPNPAIDLVRTEIAIMKKLSHINVVRLYEVLHDPSQDALFMVYELCEKGSLMSVSFEKPAKPYTHEESRNYFRQMILGIEYHIKEGILKIVDFGVSEMFTSGNDSSKNSAGSPAFFAPELCIANHGSVSAKAADVWALGVTLYCLLFGALPFAGASIVDLYESIKSANVLIPAETPADIAHLLQRILEKDPHQRITVNELRENEWITNNGKDPLPSKEENLKGVVTQVTEEELADAVKNVNSIWTIMKAVHKFKANITPTSSKTDLSVIEPEPGA
ncbi:hypothetical protein HDU97_003849 [Phlyctochytrium planicorne]|nr:hypothetical protein HDU97_003849 [Phlyctochytrium planicorne]